MGATGFVREPVQGSPGRHTRVRGRTPWHPGPISRRLKNGSTLAKATAALAERTGPEYPRMR
jgi:hypothetical protein